MGRLFGKKLAKKTTHGRGGVCPARSFAVITKLRVICRGGIYAARCNRTGYYDISEKPHGTHICVPYKPAENTASSRNIATNKSLRGRGGACPARGFAVITKLRVICRGGIYAARCNRTGYYDISEKPHGTHICVPYKPAENTASSRNIATNKSLRGRGGACPARGFAVITKLRVICRGGIYAARCNRTGYYDISEKPHGTHICVPYKPAGNRHFAYNYLPSGYS